MLSQRPAQLTHALLWSTSHGKDCLAMRFATTPFTRCTLHRQISRQVWLPLRSCKLLFFSLCLLSCHPATAQTPGPAFEVAAVKSAPQADPNTGSWSPPGTGRFTATHVSLTLLCQLAYGLDSSQIANQPGWFETNLYDIDARPEEGVKLSRDELKPRLQNLLQQRFHLIDHTETRLSRGYALVVAEGGSHLTPAKGDHYPGFRINVSPGQMRGANWSMDQFAKYLTSAAGFPVVNQTAIPGSYDIEFVYKPDSDADSMLPSLDTALKQATGLLLKPQRVTVETLVVDSVERVPTPN